MNQHNGLIQASVLELAKARGPAGFETSDVTCATIPQVGRIVQKLAAKGVLHTVRISHRKARYFDTLAHAAAFEAAKNEYKQHRRSVTTYANEKEAERGRFARSRAEWDALEPIIPKGLKKQIGQTFPESRWDVKAPKDGFASRRYGEYLAAPSSCAAKALA